MYLENTLSYFKRTFKPSGTIEGILSLTNFRIIYDGNSIAQDNCKDNIQRKYVAAGNEKI